MSNNIAFEGNPENIQRFLLQHTFQHYYRQFDAQAVSHDAALISTRTPIWLVIAINEFLDQFNVQEFIKHYKESHPEEINVNAFFKYVLTTDTFADFATYQLEQYLLGDNHQDIWANCVFDKKAKLLYPSLYGNHRGTVETILSQHRELRADNEKQTIQNQNDFIMNELILIGNKGITDYYQAKYEVRPEELMANQEPLDIIAMVQERFATFDHALNTPDNGIRYVSYCFQKPNKPNITGVSQNNIAYVLKRFAELGFIDELECALITASVDESELISSARRFWPRAWFPEHENADYKLTLLTVTRDNITNRPLCF